MGLAKPWALILQIQPSQLQIGQMNPGRTTLRLTWRLKDLKNVTKESLTKITKSKVLQRKQKGQTEGKG
jgi:hypothetical protein